MTKIFLKVTNEKPDTNNFEITCHAAYGRTGHFRWFLTDDPNSDEECKISGHDCESMTIDSCWIKRKGNNRYLGCHICLSEDDYTEIVAFLTDDLAKLLKRNTFCDISIFNEMEGRNITYKQTEEKPETK